MSSPAVFIVLLRRPRKNDPRIDPFYEVGSFGLTGCHRRNLLHPKNASRLNGGRLAFVQGGNDGARLICLTPPITIITHAHGMEARWNRKHSAGRFFKYPNAPVLVDGRRGTGVSLLKGMIEEVRRSTLEGKLSSKFRSYTRALPTDVAHALIEIHARSLRNLECFANRYEETLPYFPDIIDGKRKQTWEALLQKAVGIGPIRTNLADARCGRRDQHRKEQRKRC
jgi:hypothetical protein